MVLNYYQSRLCSFMPSERPNFHKCVVDPSARNYMLISRNRNESLFSLNRLSPQRLRKDESSTYRCISNSELVVYLQTVSNAQIQFCIFHYLRGACHWSILIPYRAQHDRYPLLPIWKHESPPPTRGAECVRAPRSSSSATCVHFRTELRHSFTAQGGSTQNIHKRTRCGT